jgi:hypothetical protein
MSLNDSLWYFVLMLDISTDKHIYESSYKRGGGGVNKINISEPSTSDNFLLFLFKEDILDFEFFVHINSSYRNGKRETRRN